MKNTRYKKAHEELGSKFELARAVIQARANAGLTQEELAKRMKTTQSVIARLESGRTEPSTKTWQRLAAATGTRVKITFEHVRKSALTELRQFVGSPSSRLCHAKTSSLGCTEISLLCCSKISFSDRAFLTLNGRLGGASFALCGILRSEKNLDATRCQTAMPVPKSPRLLYIPADTRLSAETRMVQSFSS
jgi:transcriptional regulator with XRE-family HTH domain